MNMRKLTILAVVAVASLLVRATGAPAAEWHVPGNFATIQDAINSPSVADGDRIVVGPGSHAGAVMKKRLEIKGEDGAIINDGPAIRPGMEAGFLFQYTFYAGLGFGPHPASGSIISHLRFENLAFPIFSRGADDVTVTQCTLIRPVQGVTNWFGDSWEVTHNKIIDLQTADGGGIGILFGDHRVYEYFFGDTFLKGANKNLASHNKITGTLYVAPGDGGGYAGTGIVLYADYRNVPVYSGNEVLDNLIRNNAISLKSSNPSLVPVVALELTKAVWPPTAPMPAEDSIKGNAIGFNDFRGSDTQIALTPEDLDTLNPISRNLGENRGHGLHPSVFKEEPE